MRQKIDQSVIVAIAAKLADEEGYEQVSLAAVAKQLQIRTPSLYNHVNGLPELRKQLAIYALGKLLEEMVDAALGRAGDEAVHAVALAYFNFARQHPGLYEASLSAPDPLDPDIHIIGDKIVDLILRVMEPYQLEGDDKIHAVRGLRSIVHGFAALEIKQQFNMSIDRSESLSAIMSAYIRGIRS